MPLAEHALRPAGERVYVALVIDPKPSHGHAIHLLDAGGIFVAPGHVVARACRQHLYLGMPSQAFGDIACMQLGAAVDVGTVALHDDRELHCSESGSSPLPDSSSECPSSAGPSKSELVSMSFAAGPSSAASRVGSPCGGVAES